MAIFIKSNSKMRCVSVLWLSNGSDFLMWMCSGTVCQHCILARRARPSYTFFWSRVFLHTNLAMAALQLNRLLSDYLTDESTVHVNVPFITETIINNDLLNDQQKTTTTIWQLSNESGLYDSMHYSNHVNPWHVGQLLVLSSLLVSSRLHSIQPTPKHGVLSAWVF